MNFFVTLPSNSTLQTFPNNTQSNFDTLLKQSLIFDGSYEVALTEISVPTNFNVNLGKLCIFNPFFNINDSILRKPNLNINLNCKNGQDSEQFCSILNRNIKQTILFEEYLFRWNLVNQVIKYVIKKSDTKNSFVLKVIKTKNKDIFHFKILDSEISFFRTNFKLENLMKT